MADITTNINNIKQADYGEEVRDDIVDALTKMNQETEAASKNASDATKTVAAAKPMLDYLAESDKDGNKKLAVFGPASAIEDGTMGLVPAPAKGQQECFLKADGSWVFIDAGSMTVFDANKNGLVPAPPDRAANSFLAADGAWHTLDEKGSFDVHGETGEDSGGTDVENNDREPIKFFSAKAATVWDEDTETKALAVALRWQFQRWHYQGQNGKDYPITEIHILRRTDGYASSKNAHLASTISVYSGVLNYNKKKDGSIDYSSRPDNVDDILKGHATTPLYDSKNIKYNVTYYYTLALYLNSPVTKEEVRHYNHQNNHAQIMIKADLSPLDFKTDDEPTIVSTINKARAGDLNLYEIYLNNSTHTVTVDLSGLLNEKLLARDTNDVKNISADILASIKCDLTLEKDYAPYKLSDGSTPLGAIRIRFRPPYIIIRSINRNDKNTDALRIGAETYSTIGVWRDSIIRRIATSIVGKVPIVKDVKKSFVHNVKFYNNSDSEYEITDDCALEYIEPWVTRHLAPVKGTVYDKGSGVNSKGYEYYFQDVPYWFIPSVGTYNGANVYMAFMDAGNPTDTTGYLRCGHFNSDTGNTNYASAHSVTPSAFVCTGSAANIFETWSAYVPGGAATSFGLFLDDIFIEF